MALVYVDNHIIHSRLSINFSNEYNHLKKEMIVRLDRYTPVRYRVNDDSQLMQEIFESKFTIFGHNYLSEEINKFPLFENDQSSNIDSEYKPAAVSILKFKNEYNNTLYY